MGWIARITSTLTEYGWLRNRRIRANNLELIYSLDGSAVLSLSEPFTEKEKEQTTWQTQ